MNKEPKQRDFDIRRRFTLGFSILGIRAEQVDDAPVEVEPVEVIPLEENTREFIIGNQDPNEIPEDPPKELTNFYDKQEDVRGYN